MSLLILISTSSYQSAGAASNYAPANVSFLYFPGSLTYLPLFVGIQKGFFKQQDINVSLVEGASVSAIATSLATGAIDASWQNVGYWANLVTTGVDVKMVGPYEAAPWVVVVPKTDDTTPVPGVHGATWESMLKSFAGKTVGSDAGSNVQGAQYLFNLAGLPTTGVDVIGIASEAAMVTAITQGQVNALLTITGWASAAVATGQAKIIDNLADPGKGPSVFKDSTITTTAFNNSVLQATPSLAKRWYAAMKSSVAYMHKKSSLPTLEKILGDYGITSATTPGLAALIEATVSSTVPTLTTAEYNGAMTFGAITKLFTTSPPSAKSLALEGLTN
jgi:ABC-type nitrate/sulfonate/bicarbonate transport system substrate-binding protein